MNNLDKTIFVADELMGIFKCNSDIQIFYDKLSILNKKRFAYILCWVLSLKSENFDFQGKIVGRYTGQPKGCNGIPVIVFAKFDLNGRAIQDSWICRIPLKCSASSCITVILPSNRLSKESPSVIFGNDGNFCPSDIDNFLKNPGAYVSY